MKEKEEKSQKEKRKFIREKKTQAEEEGKRINGKE